MTAPDHRSTAIRRIALTCVVLVLAVTTLSAFMRLSRAGLGCADWPACYGGAADALEAAAATPIAVARALHRLSAVAVLILAMTMAAACWVTKPVRRREGVLALALIGLALFLAVLGRYTPGARLPAVAIGNVLGGFLMLAFGFCIWQRPARAGDGRVRWLALALVPLLLVQIALGVLVSAGFAGLSCTSFPSCGIAVDASWSLLSPWRLPDLAGAASINAQGAFAHMLHRAGAVLVLVASLALARALWRRGGRATAAVLLALLGLQCALGIAMVLWSLPLPIALLHNIVAALMLALAAGQLRAPGADQVRPLDLR